MVLPKALSLVLESRNERAHGLHITVQYTLVYFFLHFVLYILFIYLSSKVLQLRFESCKEREQDFKPNSRFNKLSLSTASLTNLTIRKNIEIVAYTGSHTQSKADIFSKSISLANS